MTFAFTGGCGCRSDQAHWQQPHKYYSVFIPAKLAFKERPQKPLLIFFRHLLQTFRTKRISKPLAFVTGVLSLVECHRFLIPIEDLPLHSSTTTGQGFMRAGLHECESGALSAEIRQDEKVFKVEFGLSKKCGICFEDDGVAGCFAVDLCDQQLESSRYKSIVKQPLLRRFIWRCEILEI